MSNLESLIYQKELVAKELKKRLDKELQGIEELKKQRKEEKIKSKMVIFP